MLSYINTISLLIFIGTAVFFIWELVHFIKEYKKNKVTLPGFSEEKYQKEVLPQATPLKVKRGSVRKANLRLALLGIGAFLIVGGFSFISLTSTRRSSAIQEKEPIIKKVYSRGIAIFDKDWRVIKDYNKLKPGDVVFIGIYKPPTDDVTKARIRVNEYAWKNQHVTDKFNKEKEVFYIEYKIPSDTAKLLIEAQLYSKRDGWLTE